MYVFSSVCRYVYMYMYVCMYVCVLHVRTSVCMYVCTMYVCKYVCMYVVGIATCYVLDGPGIENRWGRDFPQPSRPVVGPTSDLYIVYRVSFPAVKWPGRGTPI
jgi:hypothetical protein